MDADERLRLGYDQTSQAAIAGWTYLVAWGFLAILIGLAQMD